MSVVLGPLLIILGVCVKWAIFPPVVDNLVSQRTFSNSEILNGLLSSLSMPGAQLLDFGSYKRRHLEDLARADQPAAHPHEVHLLQRRERR